MREVAASDARSKFGQLLDHVQHGQEIVITRRGRAAARLVPVDVRLDRAKARGAVAGILELSKGATLGGLKITGLIKEGRP